MKAPHLESSKHIHRLFPGSLHKIKFHIFHNISKCSIHGLRKFKYKNICNLCDGTQDKDIKGKIMMKTCFVLHEEVYYVFHNKLYITTIESCCFTDY